jgi:DNA-binding SARP family transcriptional activator/tetratricopeptide (TPR) repeat protein
VKFGILGPIEVIDPAGTALPLGKRKDRALLTVLLLRAGETVSVDALIDALWPTGPPARPDASLHSSVARLRRVLEPARLTGQPPTLLVRRAPGYVLELGEHTFDARHFERAARSGSEALAAGDPNLARERLHAALAEWRGPALAEFAYEPFAEREAERLEAMRLAVLEDRITADLGCGATGLVPELEQLVAAHPLRERLWEHLLVALYRAGRQTDAIRRANDVRQLLAEVGLERSPRLRALEDAILCHDTAVLEVGGLAPAAVLTEPSTRAAPAGGIGSSDSGDRLDVADERAAIVPALPRWWRRSSRGFVGRSDELHRLAVAWKAASDGEVSLVVAAGEPGIGKSWLVMEAAGRMALDGAVLAAGRCSLEPVLPFEPFVEAFGRVVDALSDADVAALGNHASRLAALLPTRAARLGAEPGHVDPAVSTAAWDRRANPDDSWDGPERRSGSDRVDRYLLFESVAALVAHITAIAPLVLVIDDLQWADRSTLRLAEHLLRADTATRLLILATVRDTDVDSSVHMRTLLDHLHRERLADELPLGGFTVEEVGEVLADQSVAPRDPELAETLREATGGNPFFVVELARSIDDAASAREPLAVPSTAQALVRSRVEALPPASRDALVTAALIGRRVDIDLVARVAGAPTETIGDALDAAERAGLLVARDQQLTFRHDLVRSELAASLGPASRTSRHRAIAEAIRSRAGDDEGRVLDALAHHYSEAAADGDPRDAVRYASAAGHQAIERLAHHTAVSRFELGLVALARSGADDPRLELDLLLDLAEAWRRTGQLSECGRAGARALPLALAVGEARDQARAVVAAGHLDQDDLTDPAHAGLVDAMKQVEDRLSSDASASADDRARVALTLASVAAELGDAVAMLERCHEARALLDAVADPATVVSVLDTTLVLVGEREPIEDRLALVQQLLDAASTVDDREAQLLAHSDARWLHLTAGDLAASREHGARYESIAAQLGMPRYHAGVAQRRAMAAILAGRWAEGEAYAAEMLEHRPDREFFEGYAAQISVIRMEQGRCEELIPLMSQVQTHTQPVWAAGASQVAAEMGDRDTAAAGLTSLSERFSRMSRDITWLTTFAVSTRTALELGDAAAAALLAAGMDEHASRIVVGGTGAVCFGPVSLYLGLLAGIQGDLERAEHWFERAHEPLVGLGAEAYLARVQLWRGELLAEKGGAARRSEALALLIDGLAGAERLGLGGRHVGRCRRLVSELR